MVQASTASDATVLLDSTSANMMHSVEFGLLFTKKAESEKLVAALEICLQRFSPAAGRLAMHAGQLVIVCNNAGIPFSWQTLQGSAPSFDSPLNADMFDCINNFEPCGEVPASGALMQIKVTDFEDSQVIAFSVCHALADARSLGQFVAAWAAAFEGKVHDEPVSHDRIGALPGPPADEEEIPEAWRSLNTIGSASFDFALALAPPTMVSLSWVRSPQDCEDLKKLYIADSDNKDLALSNNDVLCTEVLLAHGYRGDSVKLGIVMDCRAELGALALFGNMLVMLNVGLSNSEAAAAEIRKVVPTARSREFVQWKHRQATNTHPVQLCVTSWVQAFRLPELRFEDAVEDLMLGMPMMASLAQQTEPLGQRSCWLLPQRAQGVKVVTTMPREQGQLFLETERGSALAASFNDLAG